MMPCEGRKYIIFNNLISVLASAEWGHIRGHHQQDDHHSKFFLSWTLIHFVCILSGFGKYFLMLYTNYVIKNNHNGFDVPSRYKVDKCVSFFFFLTLSLE